MGNSLSKLRRFVVNKATGNKRIMIQCRTEVKKDAVRREVVGGIEQIIVSSATLPDDVVMNGVLYPGEEIEKSFETLELTHAPIEHPTDNDGNFISASDPRAIPNFYAGVMNTNVRRENGRVHIDKIINVSEAHKSDRGKRLLDRIAELENNSHPRPIHTSVGVFLTLNELDEPATNADGHEYFAIAQDMVFDHDAILLDSVGAAQPEQGVGVAVNKSGKKHKVQRWNLSEDESVSDRREAVMDALEKSPFEFHFIFDDGLFEDRVIFWSRDDLLFEVPYTIDSQGIATIVGIPLPVERVVTFVPITNAEGDAMKELILNALKKAKIETEGLSDDELFEKYNQLKASQAADNDNGEPGTGDEAVAVAAAVTKAIEPLVSRLKAVETNQTSQSDAELDKLAEIVGNSDKYQSLDAEAAKKLGLDVLKGMAANCQNAFALPLINNTEGADDSLSAPVEMVA